MQIKTVSTVLTLNFAKFSTNQRKVLSEVPQFRSKFTHLVPRCFSRCPRHARQPCRSAANWSDSDCKSNMPKQNNARIDNIPSTLICKYATTEFYLLIWRRWRWSLKYNNNAKDNIYSAIIYSAKPSAWVYFGSSEWKSVSARWPPAR